LTACWNSALPKHAPVTRSLSYEASAGPSTYEKSELHDVDSCGGKKGSGSTAAEAQEHEER